MKNLYKELNTLLGNSPVVELKNLEKEKELKANLLIKCAECSVDPKDSIVDDRRIKILISDIDNYSPFSAHGETLKKTKKLLEIHIPDIKIFAAGADMTNIPDICTGFVKSNPANSGLVLKSIKDFDDMEFKSISGKEDSLKKAGAILAGAIELAKKQTMRVLTS